MWKKSFHFWATICKTVSLYAIRPLSVCSVCLVLSVTLVYCGKTVGWIKMPLGTEVGLVPGHIVLDGTQLPHKKGHSSPRQFLAHVYCGQMAGWIKMPLGADVGHGPGNIVLDGDPAPPRERGTAPPPLFGSLYSGTVAHLSYCWALVSCFYRCAIDVHSRTTAAVPCGKPDFGIGTLGYDHIRWHKTFLQRVQCSHCKRCISYSNSIRLSVRLSITCRYCVKTTAHSTVQFSPLDSKMCLVL